MTRAPGRARRRARAGLLTAALVAGLGLTPAPARAHHTPGHSASEGVRTINSLGGTGGRARTRLLLLNEYSYTGQGLNPGHSYILSLYGEYAPIPDVSVAVQAPLQVAAFKENDYAPLVGYGNTRVALRVTPHARKLIHRVLSTGFNLSIPTRTITFPVDPGRIWVVTPYVMFTRTYTQTYYQVIALLPVESRPAGVAVDLSLGGQVGTRLLDSKLSAGFGALVDVRLANWKATVDGGLEFTPETRPGEGLPGSSDDRPIGATRIIGTMNTAYNFARWGSLIASLQLPLTPRHDFTVGGSLGLQVFF
ncbi:MAG: hypothetical protein H6713_04845 [Myxococcales bacterium]|nr:hypothetical protein [Myxococcales bacterium]